MGFGCSFSALRENRYSALKPDVAKRAGRVESGFISPNAARLLQEVRIAETDIVKKDIYDYEYVV